MSKRTVSAKGGATPAKGHNLQPDPVAEIGAKLAIAADARKKLDERIAEGTIPDSEARRDMERDRDALDNYIDALADTALSQPAKTLAGAMLQVALLHHHMEGMWAAGGSIEQRCEFGVQSIVDILARESGVDREALGVDYFAGARLGMPRRFEAALSQGRR
jgi:hypothetical protein